MTHADVDSVADALAYIRERRQMTREALHMLCEQFPKHASQLIRAAKDAGVRLDGPRGL